jgi:hypothetical protein
MLQAHFGAASGKWCGLWIGSSVGTAGFVAAGVRDELHRDVCSVVLGPHAEAPLAAHVAESMRGGMARMSTTMFGLYILVGIVCTGNGIRIHRETSVFCEHTANHVDGCAVFAHPPGYHA